MYEHLEFQVKGVAPLLCHNGALADPLNKITQKMKEITGKKKKTDTDHEELGRLEFLGGLYLDDKGHPCMPGINIEGMMLDAAKRKRMGNDVKCGIISDGNWPIIYDGPKEPEKMWPKFADRRGAKLQGKVTIIRTRPIFHNWSLKFVISFLPSILNKKDVIELVALAGQAIGLGDYVPRYGRFEVV